MIAAVMCIGFWGCENMQQVHIAATTAPVYEFTAQLCQGTDIKVQRLVTENVSCLHDYTLQVSQMRTIENAQMVAISGAGLEGFLDDALTSAHIMVDASSGIDLICNEHSDEHAHKDHHHESDPHIWLSPANAKVMATNIYLALIEQYPQHSETFYQNLQALEIKFNTLSDYAQAELKDLSCKDLITFHDGFSYMADAFDLHILEAIEEESGSEASAAELIELAQLVKDNRLTSIFTEINGSTSAAEIIAAETGTKIYTLDMAMGDTGYFEAMYHNIDTLKEALE